MTDSDNVKHVEYLASYLHSKHIMQNNFYLMIKVSGGNCFSTVLEIFKLDMMENIFFEVKSGHRGQSCGTENPEKLLK